MENDNSSLSGSDQRDLNQQENKINEKVIETLANKIGKVDLI